MKLFSSIALLLTAMVCSATAQPNPNTGRTGSYIFELPSVQPQFAFGGYQASSQNVTRRFAYGVPRIYGSSGPPYVGSEEWAQPWVDLSYGDRTSSNYHAKFDFNQVNESFYGHINVVVDDAKSRGAVVILVLMQGDDYGGDQWTYNPFRAGNNVNGIDAGSYFTLETNPATNVRNIIKAYIATMIDHLGTRDNYYLEVMNEGVATSSAWQEELTNYIHSYALAHSKIVPVMRTPFSDTPNTAWPGTSDPLHFSKTTADAISVWSGNGPPTTDFPYGDCYADFNTYPTAKGYPIPVYWDTDHNCPRKILNATQISALCNKGYNILQWSIGDPASEALLGSAAGQCNRDNPPPPPPPPSGFVTGIDVNGTTPNLVIEGNTWKSQAQAAAAGFTVTGIAGGGTTSFTLSPATDAATTTMMDTAYWRPRGQGTVAMTQPLANGNYKVYIWLMEDWMPHDRSMIVQLQGVNQTPQIGDLAYGTWAKYGPFNFTVTNGSMSLNILQGTKGDPTICGLAIFTQ